MKYTQTRGALDDDPNLILKLMGEQDNYQMFQDDLKQLDATAKTQFRTTFNAFGEDKNMADIMLEQTHNVLKEAFDELTSMQQKRFVEKLES